MVDQGIWPRVEIYIVEIDIVLARATQMQMPYHIVPKDLPKGREEKMMSRLQH